MQGELGKYEDKLEKATDAEQKTGNEATEMGNDIQGASTKTGGFKDKLKEFTSSSIGQFASITAAVALAKQALQALWDTIADAAAWADEIVTLSMVTGVATEKLQEYGYAARFIDTEVETITKSMARLTRSMYNAERGSKEQKDAFDQVGLRHRQTAISKTRKCLQKSLMR